MNKRNPRVGCKGGDHLMPVSFRDHDEAFVRKVQRAYSTGFYTQVELANKYRTSSGLINKICRVDAGNVDAAMRSIKKRLKQQPSMKKVS